MNSAGLASGISLRSLRAFQVTSSCLSKRRGSAKSKVFAPSSFHAFASRSASTPFVVSAYRVITFGKPPPHVIVAVCAATNLPDLLEPSKAFDGPAGGTGDGPFETKQLLCTACEQATAL